MVNDAPAHAGGRGSGGYAEWRLIAEELRASIGEGTLADGTKLPTELALAERFSVNRHTVRQAIAALAEEGLVQTRRGSGSYVTGAPEHVHRIGLRTRLSDSLGDLARRSRTAVLESVIEAAPDEVARRLGLPGGLGLRIETARSVAGSPLSLGTHWLDPARFAGLAESIRARGSITGGLRELGVDDYVRASTTVSARLATAVEASRLRLGRGAVVLVARSVDALLDGAPIQVSITRFAASRVQLDIEHAAI